ncbi:hypothetical protein BJ508DRAFT_189206, partial [Ascobolus immersus RN42]
LLTTVLLSAQLASAHFQIAFPGWRGNTLEGEAQWKYPCGGLAPTTNRTKWPVTGGGALSVIPGWNAGHPTAFFYVNMGFGNSPTNATHPMLPVFQIVGPSKDPFPGTFCLPQVPLPKDTNVKVGDNATIQVIQVALHGAALYNCADITFVDPKDAAVPEPGLCENSSTISYSLVYTTTSRSA